MLLGEEPHEREGSASFGRVQGWTKAGYVMGRRGLIRGMGKAETSSAERGMSSLSTLLFPVP